jgi:hypothetical protein
MARGEGSVSSDLDNVLVRPDDLAADGSRWLSQKGSFVDDVTVWTGNLCRVVEYSVTEFHDVPTGPEHLTMGLRTDGITLTRRRLPLQTALSTEAQ